MTSRPAPLPDPETGDDLPAGAAAFVIDAVAGAVVAANDAGRQVWGLPAGTTCIAAALDRAMPALARLSQAARCADAETLTFWTARGLLELPCRVERTAQGRFLVRALAGDGAVFPRPRADAVRTARPAAAPTADLARLAHEVRTPLSAAIAYAELLKAEHFGPLGSTRYREYAAHVYDSARLALSVVDGMLARAPGETLPELAFRDLDPAEMIDACVAVAKPLAERAGLHLTAHCDQGAPRVVADEVSLKQMLLNLVTNAIKFARPGDGVALSVVYGTDGCLRIEVADTGPGMPEALGGELEMEVIASAAPPGEAGRNAGRGIGLPLTRALAEANGASLVVDSAPGRGTRVTIAFAKDRVVPV